MKAFSRISALTVAAAAMFAATSAHAIPALQVYIEGSTYDTSTESWSAEFAPGDTIRLWAIGNVAGSGGVGGIYGVKLAIAYAHGDTPVINLTSSTTGGYGGYTDPSTAATPTLIQTRTDGSVPILGDGAMLPSHGEYGAGTDWAEYSLGDFTKTDSPISDFISGFPTAGSPNKGQINVYNIQVSGTSSVHFDLYDHYFSGSKNKVRTNYIFSPFSHDGEAHSVPDGGTTVSLLGLGISLAGIARRYTSKRRA